MTAVPFEMDKTAAFFAPHKTLLGNGSAAQVGSEVRKLGLSKVLIITDQGVVQAGLHEAVIKSLKTQGIDSTIFDRVEPEPPDSIIDESAARMREGRYDLVLGLGGGSSLDTAKAAAALSTNPGSILDYTGVDQLQKPGAPLVLIPTTAGTGSETTRVLVLTDEKDQTKKVVFSDFLLPHLAVLDPILTMSMPPKVTADTGLDALVHAVETFVSMNTTPYAQILALEAIRLIGLYLPQAYAKGSNLKARYHMLLAANLAGMAFASGGLGAVHGLAYVLGTEYHLPHGRSNAIMLPHVMDYNKTGCLDQFARMAEALGEDIRGLNRVEAADSAVLAVGNLLLSLDVPFDLDSYGIPKDDLPKLVAGGMAQCRLFEPNPRDLSEADVAQIYQSAFEQE